MIKMILFDLDGTLLPMDQEIFTKKYFKRLAAKLAPYGYEPQKLIDSIWAGTAAMAADTGRICGRTGSSPSQPRRWPAFGLISSAAAYRSPGRTWKMWRCIPMGSSHGFPPGRKEVR